MWWLGLLAATAALWLVSDDREARRLLALFMGGVLAMQTGKLLPLGGTQWIYSAFIWLVVSLASLGAISRQSFTFAGVMLLNVMCYTVGRVAGFEFAAMEMPIAAADVVGWAAISIIGGPGIVRRVGKWIRNRRVGLAVDGASDIRYLGGVERSDNRDADAKAVASLGASK